MVRLTPPNYEDTQPESGLRPSEQIKAVFDGSVDEGAPDPTVLVERKYGYSDTTILFAADANQELWTARPTGPDHRIPQFPGIDFK